MTSLVETGNFHGLQYKVSLSPYGAVVVVNFVADISGCGEYICDKGVLGRTTTRPLPVCE